MRAQLTIAIALFLLAALSLAAQIGTGVSVARARSYPTETAGEFNGSSSKMTNP